MSCLLGSSSQSCCWLWVDSFLRLSITNKLCGRLQASWKRWRSTLAVLSSVDPGECDSPADLILQQKWQYPIFCGQPKSEMLPCFSQTTRDSRYQDWDWKCQTSLPGNACKDHQCSAAREQMPLFHDKIACPVPCSIRIFNNMQLLPLPVILSKFLTSLTQAAELRMEGTGWKSCNWFTSE